MSRKASVKWGEQRLCMPCLYLLREKKGDPEYSPGLKIWDNRALGLLTLLPLTIFTGPAALFVLFRFRRNPKSWVPRSSFRWWLSLTLTLIVLMGWTALVVVWVAMLTRELS